MKKGLLDRLKKVRKVAWRGIVFVYVHAFMGLSWWRQADLNSSKDAAFAVSYESEIHE